MAAMLADANLVGFVPSTDLDRSERFFGEALGIRLRERTEYALVFDASGTELRVTLVGTLTPHPFTVLGWSVSDLSAEMSRLAERGVAFTRYEGIGQDAQGVWTTPDGSGVAWFTDPDGNVLSLHGPIHGPIHDPVAS